MIRWKFDRTLVPIVFVVLSLFSLYGVTLAPGLTWANSGSDGGDLITAAYTGGIAHPTGYPLYVLLARLFQWLPIGSLAYRTNLMSAVCTALTAGLVYLLVVRGNPHSDSLIAGLTGLGAGYAFGLAPLVWSQAVITEVYALQALLVTLILVLFIQPNPTAPRDKKRLDAWRGLLLGLALGNHVTTALMLPPALLLGSLRKNVVQRDEPENKRGWFSHWRFDWKAFTRQVLWMGLGLSLYLSLPLRALSDPPVNWGNPVTPERFWWLVSGGVYQSYYLPEAFSGIGRRIQALAVLSVEQFGLPGITIGLFGLIVFGRCTRRAVLTTWTFILFSLLAILYRAQDSYVYWIPACIAFAIWTGEGISGLAQIMARRSPWLGFIPGVLMLIFLLFHAASYFNQIDASTDMRAEDFGQEVFSVVPRDALVFASGDKAVFTLWYFHFALGQRPDLRIIASDLLHFDWYQETLRSTYPSLVVPGPFPWPTTIAAANPYRNVCYIRYGEQAEIECSY